ncbi:MAG: hypothetical protein D6776_01305 [Planctomycetota bacterium]|nr:MAG: hypothetical protein D6776_01305 [Planctomycetota bacterium]
MALAGWILSFLFLAAVASWVCTAVREDDDTEALERARGFFTMILVGTTLFSAAVWAIEWLT